MSQQKHTAEFESCVEQVMEQGHDKESAFAICTDSFKKAGKPIFVGEAESQKLHLFCESFKLEGNHVSGVAIHPRRIFHPEEDMTHVYLKEELEKAAKSLTGKPFGIDHAYILPPPNIVTKSWYCERDGKEGVCFEGTVDDHIAQQIREKAFKGISIELDWLREGGSVHYVNGVAAKNFILTSLHLLRRFPPGDPDAFVKLFEAAEKKLLKLKEQLVVAPAKPLDEQLLELRQNFENFRNEINERLARIEGALGQVTVPPSPLGLKNPAKAKRGMKMKEAEWDTEYINNLNDSAFAVVASGGEKDDEGKTTPRNLRKLPHHNAEGNLDLDHLRNALARVNQIEGGDKAKAKKHLCGHARGEKAEDLVSEFCGEEPSTAESLKTLHSFLKQFKEQPEVEQCVLDGVALGLGNEEIAEKCDVTLITVQEIRGGLTGLYEALKKLKEQQGNQEPEKDEHGCVVGKERWNAETEKCVPIETMKEQQGEETDEHKQFMAQCLEGGKTMEQCVAEWEQKQEGGETQGAQAESIVGLRKKLVEVEAQLVKMEKQQKRKAATWKEKYEKLREAVKGAIPMPRVWKSWTPGPQRYVQENLKILREVES